MGKMRKPLNVSVPTRRKAKVGTSEIISGVTAALRPTRVGLFEESYNLFQYDLHKLK